MEIIKPGDLVETPSGRHAKVIEVEPGRNRLLQYCDNREGVVLPAALLKVLRAAPVRPWPKA